ncbi:TonB-dependent receptor [uncultured Porphyromonas sp.]|uniref:TonB-dependent receptor domain-containing protein n=1 Tax=uncultured Porphyromonas sp. TaxID=159274 RepID=UPI0026376F95|nr:TonB-dependent receptor [uncultured Porphyromonas sp.]
MKTKTAYHLACTRILGLVLLFACSLSGLAQEQKKLELKILSPSGEGVDSAYLMLSFCQAKSIEGRTDKSGHYVCPIPEGCSTLTLWIWGSADAIVDTTLSVATTRQHIIRLEDRIIEGVKIVATRPSVQMNAEGTTYQITTEGLLSSAKAPLVLQRIPDLIYDGGSFTIPGTRGQVTIYVDEVPVNERFLSQLDARDIDRVEVRPSDVASSSGGGAIYIYRKKHPGTLKGELGMRAGLINEEYTVSPSLSYLSKTFDLVTSGSVITNKQHPHTRTLRNGVEVLDIQSNTRLTQYNAEALLNAVLSERFKASLSYLLFGYEERLRQSITKPLGMKRQEYLIGRNLMHTANLILSYQLAPEQSLLVRAQGLLSNEARTREGVSGDYSARMSYFVGDVAYDHDELPFLGTTHALRLGARLLHQRSVVEGSAKPHQMTQGQLYLKDNFYLAKGLSLYFLLRNEWGRYGLEANRRSYFSFIPYVSLAYSQNGYSARLSFDRDLSRPEGSLLSPAEYFVSELDRKRGNPNLKPQTSLNWALSLGKSFGKSRLVLTASHEELQDLITGVSTTTPNLSTFENAGEGRLSSLTSIFRTSAFDYKLNLQVYAGLRYSDYQLKSAYRASALNATQRGWGLRCGGSVSLMLKGDWFFNASVNYNSPTYAFSSRTIAEPLTYLSAQKSLLNGRLTFSLSAMAPWGLGEYRRTEMTFRGIEQVQQSSLSLSNVSLGVSFRFGKGEAKEAPSDAIDASGLKRRDQ